MDEKKIVNVQETNADGQTTIAQESNAEKVVLVAEGAGTEPIKVTWVEGMTVTDALDTAGITLARGEIAVVGEIPIENPDETLVEPGQMIVTDYAPANG